MRKVDISEASKHLPDLMEQAAQGQEIVITRGDGAAVKLVPTLPNAPKPTFGSAQGEVWMSDDFDETLADFKDYMRS